MASVLGLALKISADATGIQKSLTPVERALKQLDTEAAKVTEVFKTFATASGGAGRAQQQFATDLAFLQSALRAGKIDGEQFAAEFEKISAEATKTAEAFREGAAITVANRTEEEKRAEELARLNELLKLGAIEQETFNRAAAEASGANKAAAAAAAEAAKTAAAADKTRADQATRAAAIVEANLTKEQKAQRDYGVSTRELNALRKAGLLTEAEYSTALQRVSKDYAKATLAADKFGKESAGAGDAGKLKFNELSGVLSALPGPIGNVAGRLSGLASAAEGVSRLAAGGLSQGLGAAGTALAALANPVGIAVAGVAALAASTAAASPALANLAGKVEELSFAARQAGVGFQAIQVLDEAASRAGVSVDALAAGVQRFGKRLSDAAKGTGDAYKGLQQLGFSLEQIQQGQNDPTEFASRVATALEQIPEPARQAQLQLDVLGKGGESLIRAFGELPGAELAVRRFGGAITDLDKDRLLELDGAFENLQRSALGLGRELLTPFIGQVQSLAEGFAPAITSFGRALGNLLDAFSPVLSVFGLFINGIAQVASVVLNLIATALEPLAVAGRAVGQAIDEASKYVTEFWTGINDAIESVRGFLGAIFGGIEATAEKTAAAVALTAEETEDAAKAAIKAQEDLEKAFEAGSKALDGIIAKSAEFGQAGFDAAYEFQQALADLQEQANEADLNAEQYARGVANATAEYEKQIDAIKKVADATKKAADEAKKKAEDDKKRIEELLNPNDSAAKVQKDIQFVIEQQAAAEKQLADARAKSDKESADAAAVRLAQLDQLRAKLEDQQQAIDQGFANGFADAFNNTSQSVSDLVDKAGEFGNAGAEAAMKLQEGVALAQQQARDGVILSSDVYEKEISRQRSIFEDRLKQIEAVRQKEKAARDEAASAIFNQQTAANERVKGFLTQQTSNEIAAAEEVAARRQQAAFNVEAIEQQLNLERQSLQAAREQGDRQASAAAVERVNQLREALTVEQQISEGRQKQIVDQKQLLVDQRAYQEQQLAAANAYQQQQQKAQEAYAQEQAKIFEEQQRAAAAEAKRQEERLEKLNTLGSTTIKSQDVRTTEGASLVLQTIANGQDPALIQQRLQTKYLEAIALGIGQASSNYFNSPVAIVGYSSFGQR